MLLFLDCRKGEMSNTLIQWESWRRFWRIMALKIFVSNTDNTERF
jgi:hypothetical protein